MSLEGYVVQAFKRFVGAALCSLIVLYVPLPSVLAQVPADSLAVLFTLPSLDGRKLSLQSLYGEKLTIIVFWATWGKDSSRMLEELQELYAKYNARGLQVIGVCVDSQSITEQDKQRIADTVQRKSLAFPIALDDSLRTFRAYSVVAVPTTFAVNREGKILRKLSGYPVVGRGEFFEFVVEQFEGKRPVVAKISRVHTPSKDAIRQYNMARVNYERGQADLALKYAEKAAGLDSLYAEPFALLAAIAIDENRMQNADSLDAVAMRLEPDLVETKRVHSLLLAKNGKVTEALSLLTDLVKSDSTSSETHSYFGYALGMSGSIERALAEFARAESLSNSDFRIPLLRAEVYEHAGKKAEADAERSKAKRLKQR